MYYACSDYKVWVVSLTKSVSRRHICSLALPTITYFVQCMPCKYDCSLAFLAIDKTAKGPH